MPEFRNKISGVWLNKEINYTGGHVMTSSKSCAVEIAAWLRDNGANASIQTNLKRLKGSFSTNNPAQSFAAPGSSNELYVTDKSYWAASDNQEVYFEEEEEEEKDEASDNQKASFEEQEKKNEPIMASGCVVVTGYTPEQLREWNNLSVIAASNRATLESQRASLEEQNKKNEPIMASGYVVVTGHTPEQLQEWKDRQKLDENTS